ncbi:hypothetical protein SLS56_008315 [Neofusicoccum ribis]|uniref:Uncharacterized protein n=1 Tax=Neofusicoccum ribis TaxID=45134 RepID=A0ABR3SLW4_9PEZI
MAVIPITAPFPNSSYTIEFFGPSLKCENLAEPNSTTNKTLFNEEITSQIESKITRDLAVNTLLVYNAIQPLSLAHNLFINLNGNSDENKNISCSFWNSSYTVNFNFSDGVQSTKTTLDHLEQITYDRPQVPSEYPPNGEGYESMYLALSNLIVGQFGESTYDGSFIQEKTSIPITGIAVCPEIANGSMWQTTTTNNWLSAPMSPWMCRSGSVERALEDLSHNFTLSLFSSEFLSGNTTTPVRVSFPQNHYTYNKKDLLISYLVGIFATLLCVLLGWWSYYRNGYSAKKKEYPTTD